jgi:hypothetical protein
MLGSTRHALSQRRFASATAAEFTGAGCGTLPVKGRVPFDGTPEGIMRGLAFIAAMLAAAGPASAENYRPEAEQLAKEIVEVHPRGAEIAASPSFIAARDALFAMAGDTDLSHYAVALGRMFHAVNDGHTACIPIFGDAPEFTQHYPLRLRRFDDGLYVVAAKGAALPLLGARLTRIGGKGINALIREFAAAQAAGNRAWPTRWAEAGLTIPGFLVGLDVATRISQPVRFETIDAHMKRAVATLTPSADAREGLQGVARKKSVLETQAGDEANRAFEIEDGRALVLSIGAMEDGEKKSFETFTSEAAAALRDTKAERVVIDLRDNGGGNNLLAEPLRRTLVKSRFNRPGGLYVLTSPATFSAAMNFTTRLERETDALFAGEPTGGSPNHSGDPKFAQAPISKIPYLISTLRWQDSTPFDKREWIMPDLPAPPAFADYVAGRDRALEAALAHDAGADPGTDWRDRVVKPWERDSQHATWHYFYEAP